MIEKIIQGAFILVFSFFCFGLIKLAWFIKTSTDDMNKQP